MQSEKFLQYIWQHRLFDACRQQTTDGDALEIIDVGRPNTNAGPDFFNAKIRIGQKLWAGNVEIHCASSDWKRHGHSSDESYDSVILHVVGKADCRIFRKTGEEIPQLELKFSDEITKKYNSFSSRNDQFPCAGKIKTLPPLFVTSWTNALLIERLMRKSGQIDAILAQTHNDWSEAFYISLARSFGFGLNSDPFERLARAVPLICLQKHRNNLLQIEALLFGAAGLIPANPQDEYTRKLHAEAAFLMQKFSLSPPENLAWKTARMRPQNAPCVRVAQFARLIFKSSKLFPKIVGEPTYENIAGCFSGISADEYWENHCSFDKESVRCPKRVGTESVRGIVINTVVPFLFSYSTQTDDEPLREKAIELLEKIPAERNHIVGQWQEMGIASRNAAESQAVLELQKEYCDKKDCLRCRISHKIIGNGK